MFPQLLPDLILVTTMCLVVALALGFASIRFRSDIDEAVEQINELLPQTQCAQCGHPGCRPYAQSIASGEAINRCPRLGGRGASTIQVIVLLRILYRPLDRLIVCLFVCFSF